VSPAEKLLLTTRYATVSCLVVGSTDAAGFNEVVISLQEKGDEKRFCSNTAEDEATNGTTHQEE
jgi:hypothetical protein